MPPGQQGVNINDPTLSTLTNPTIQKLLADMKMLQGALGKQGGGAAPRPTTPGFVGQTTMPPLPFNTGGARPPVSPQPFQPSGAPPIPSTGGVEFSQREGARSATIQGTMAAVQQAINYGKQKQEQKKAREAEGYVSQLNAALQSGDKDMVDTMLTDPKIVNTIQKGLDYHFAREPGGEPEPPEAKGVKAFFQKIAGKQQPQPPIPPPGQPGGIMLPKPGADQQLQNAVSNYRLQRAQQDPTFMSQLATGSTLSGQESKQAEKIAAGLDISPAELRKLDVASQNALVHTYGMITIQQMKAESDKAKAQLGYSGKVDAAHIMAAAKNYATDVLKEHLDLNQKDKLQMQLDKANLDNYRHLVETYTKAQTGANVSTADKANFKMQAESYQRKYDQLQQDISDREMLQGLSLDLNAAGAGDSEDDEP